MNKHGSSCSVMHTRFATSKNRNDDSINSHDESDFKKIDYIDEIEQDESDTTCTRSSIILDYPRRRCHRTSIFSNQSSLSSESSSISSYYSLKRGSISDDSANLCSYSTKVIQPKSSPIISKLSYRLSGRTSMLLEDNLLAPFLDENDLDYYSQRLNFHPKLLHGRQYEIDFLMDAYRRISMRRRRRKKVAIKSTRPASVVLTTTTRTEDYTTTVTTTETFHRRHSCFHSACGDNENMEQEGKKGNNNAIVNNIDLCTHGRMVEIILLHGQSGVGKSAIVGRFRNKIIKRRNTDEGIIPLIGEGKYDQDEGGASIVSVNGQRRQQPYSGFASAFHEICSSICEIGQQHSDLFRRIHDSIEQLIGWGSSNYLLLKGIIPGITLIEEEIGKHQQQHFERRDSGGSNCTATINGRSTSSSSFEGARGRIHMHNMIQLFLLAIINAHDDVIITIILDDIHWIDLASLELLEDIIKDSRLSSGLLLVVCYRNGFDGNGTQNHQLITRINQLREEQRLLQMHTCCNACLPKRRNSDTDNEKTSSRGNCTISYLPIENLDFDATHELIVDILNIDDDSSLGGKEVRGKSYKTNEFTKIIHRRTLGNAFFVIQFLEKLRDDRRIFFNVLINKWEWDEESVRSSQIIANNALCILQDKIQKWLLSQEVSPNEWEWDEDYIRSSQIVANSVFGVFQDKIQKRLNQDELFVLQVGSCLGPSFDASVISHITTTLMAKSKDRPESTTDNDNDKKDNVVVDSLRMAVDEGFLDFGDDNGMYHFVHHQIQLAAYSMIPKEEVDLMKYHIGFALLDFMKQDKERPLLSSGRSTLLVATDLLNCSYKEADRFAKGNCQSFCFPCDRLLLLATLNLQAGYHAMKISAFEAASAYFSQGISVFNETQSIFNAESEALSSSLLNSSQEETDPKKVLLLLRTGATKAEYCNGNFNDMHCYSEQVLNETSWSFQDKLPVYTTLLDYYFSQHQTASSVKLGLDILRQLGLKFNGNKQMSVICSWIKTKRLIGNREVSNLKELPLMVDQNKITAMEVMNYLLTSAYREDKELLARLVFRMVRWSIKHGICKYSASAFCFYGSFLAAAFGEPKKGHEFSKLAINVLKRCDEKEEFTSSCLYLSTLTVNHWVEPLPVCQKQFLEGYEIGLKTGDLATAGQCIMGYTYFSFYKGRKLSHIEHDFKVYIQQMEGYKQKLSVQCMLVQLDLVMSLMGKDEEASIPSVFQKSIDEALRSTYGSDNSDTWLKDVVLNIQQEKACWFHDYELAGTLLEKTTSFEKKNAGLAALWRRSLYDGVTSYALARRKEGKAKKWKVRANKVRKKVQKWVEQGNGNCLHILHLLDAEHMAMDSKKQENVLSKFDLAISTAARGGLQQDRAFFSVRAGQYCLQRKNNEKANDYIRSAYHNYMRWDADALAKHLKREFPCVFDETISN